MTSNIFAALPVEDSSVKFCLFSLRYLIKPVPAQISLIVDGLIEKGNNYLQLQSKPNNSNAIIAWL